MNNVTHTIEIGGFLRYFSGNIQDDEWLNSSKLLKLPGLQQHVAASMVLTMLRRARDFLQSGKVIHNK